MKPGRVFNYQLARQLAARPPEYLRELERLIIKRDRHGFWIDLDDPRYAEMVAKYADAGTPRPEGGAPANIGSGCCGPPSGFNKIETSAPGAGVRWVPTIDRPVTPQ